MPLFFRVQQFKRKTRNKKLQIKPEQNKRNRKKERKGVVVLGYCSFWNVHLFFDSIFINIKRGTGKGQQAVWNELLGVSQKPASGISTGTVMKC